MKKTASQHVAQHQSKRLSFSAALQLLIAGPVFALSDDCEASGIHVSTEQGHQKLTLEGFPFVSFLSDKTCGLQKTCVYTIVYSNRDSAFEVRDGFEVFDICTRIASEVRQYRNAYGSSLPSELAQHFPIQSMTFARTVAVNEDWIEIVPCEHHKETDGMQMGFWHGHNGDGGGLQNPVIVTYQVNMEYH